MIRLYLVALTFIAFSFGLQAQGPGRQASLAWDSNPVEEGVEGYRLYAKGPDQASFELVAETATNEASVTLAPGKWSIYVTAFSVHQNPPHDDGTPGETIEHESGPSNTLILSLPSAPRNLKLQGAIKLSLNMESQDGRIVRMSLTTDEPNDESASLALYSDGKVGLVSLRDAPAKPGETIFSGGSAL